MAAVRLITWKKADLSERSPYPENVREYPITFRKNFKLSSSLEAAFRTALSEMREGNTVTMEYVKE